MAKKEKRKPRDKEQKKVNLLVPIIGIDKFGGAEDPCFGKLYEPRAEECQRCGDCELCAISMGQLNHKLRAKEESSKNFKDIEETKIKVSGNTPEIRKEIRKAIRKIIKITTKEVDIEIIIDEIYAAYSKDGFMKSKIRKMIIAVCEDSNQIVLHKNKVQWIQ